jgi:hypothetical protein
MSMIPSDNHGLPRYRSGINFERVENIVMLTEIDINGLDHIFG